MFKQIILAFTSMKKEKALCAYALNVENIFGHLHEQWIIYSFIFSHVSTVGISSYLVAYFCTNI